MEKITKSAGRLLHEISKAAIIYFQNELKGYSIGPAQVKTLLFITENPGLNQIELANNLNLDKSSITSQLKILQSNGYITRYTSDKDGRMQLIKITEKTREIIEPLREIFAAWTDILFTGVDKNERDIIIDYLEKMRDNAKDRINEK